MGIPKPVLRFFRAAASRALLAFDEDRPRLVTGVQYRNLIAQFESVQMARTNPLFPPIDAVVEKENITFDFGLLLSPGANLVSVVNVFCTVAAQSLVQDPSASTRVLTAPIIINAPNPPVGSGIQTAAVLVQIGTCVGWVTYVVQCVAIASDGQQLSIWAYLPCVTPA